MKLIAAACALGATVCGAVVAVGVFTHAVTRIEAGVLLAGFWLFGVLTIVLSGQ